MKFTIPDKNRKQIANAIMGLLAALLMLLANLGGQAIYQLLDIGPAPDDPILELGTTHFTALSVEDLEVTDDVTITDDVTLSTGDLTITAGSETITAGNLTLTAGDVTLTAGDETITAGDLTVSAGDFAVTVGDGSFGDDVTVADVLRGNGEWVVGEQTVVVVTAGSMVTPLGTYQPITSATAALTLSTTNSIADGSLTGQLLVLINENAAYTITVKDAANTALSGDFTMGPKDSLYLIWDGADWVQIAETDN